MMDISLDETDDLVVMNGDVLTAECTMQHQRLLILTEKGEWKHDPTMGVGAFNYLDNDAVQELPRAISQEFARDGMKVQKVEVLPNGTINSHADYE